MKLLKRVRYTMEYYSAIKKNTFESVLMRWMKLEPIIQSDQASQKDTVGCLNQISGNDGTKTVQELVSQMREEDILS